MSELQIDNQRLRNLTTGRLHTDVSCVYEDLEIISGEKGLMTHMLPRMMRAVMPWLIENVGDPRFWDSEYDVTHTGTYYIPVPTETERAEMVERYMAQNDPLEGKVVVPVIIGNKGEDRL
jgi:hypothetical protein